MASGTAFSFKVTTTGTPTPAIGLASGSSLPSAVTLTDNHDGTATLAGTSGVAAGVYDFTMQASNSAGSINQAFVLTVSNSGPTISLTFKGLITYTNSGSLTSGGFTVNSSKGVITSVTGTGTIVGLKSGSATVTANIHRFFFIYIGTIEVTDPASHLKTTSIVLSTRLTLTDNNVVTGSALDCSTPWIGQYSL